jgi:4-amino-4-deoxy-L-arabinose transferase-like glycosyltransferase
MISDPPETGGGWTRRRMWLLVGVLALGVAARLTYVDRPLDHRVVNAWRQSDYTQIARNFDREGMNLFYPRVDWRGDTPGYAEMELPLMPWFGAALYRVFGPHEQILRGLSALFATVGLLLFAVLARRLLPPAGALFAVAAYAVNPLLLVLSTSIQPEPLLECLTLLTVLLLLRWTDRPSPGRLFAAAAAAAAAMSTKLPSAYLGVLVAYVVLRTRGARALADPRVFAAALVALGPPAAWYVWSHGFWLAYGNSLGLSNETHTIGWDMLWPPKFLVGIGLWETLGVFTPVGWLLALAALRLPRRRWELLWVWYGAVALFYLVAARTTADKWAYYYHVLSVAPAALLMGGGVAGLLAGGWRPSWLPGGERAWIRAAAIATLAGLVAGSGFLIARRDYAREELRVMQRCMRAFAPQVPPNGRIVVRGGTSHDEYGRPVAHNESMAFAWMDRKGFNYADEDLGIDVLDRIAARGGRYWIVHRGELGEALRAAVESRYRRIDQCDGEYTLFDLDAEGSVARAPAANDVPPDIDEGLAREAGR